MNLTIIITTFNSELYIENLLNNILSSKFNGNILVIDDKSDDDTPKILKKIAKNNNKIELILNKKNLGLVKARLKAITYIKTDFLIFIDSDDNINLDILVNVKLEKDIIFLKGVVLNKNGKVIDYLNPCIKKIWKNFLIGYWSISSVIFSKSIFNKISFLPNYYIGEDFNLFQLINNENTKIYKSFIPFYFYIKRDNSLMSTSNLKKYQHLIENIKNVIYLYNLNTIDNDIKLIVYFWFLKYYYYEKYLYNLGISTWNVIYWELKSKKDKDFDKFDFLFKKIYLEKKYFYLFFNSFFINHYILKRIKIFWLKLWFFIFNQKKRLNFFFKIIFYELYFFKFRNIWWK